MLHPSQAKDLEACAYELMREAKKDKTQKNGAADAAAAAAAAKVTMMESHLYGPVRWCRDRLLPFFSPAKGEIP